MSRRVIVCLCTVMTLVALVGAPGFLPSPVLAASGTLTLDTPLHDSPDPAAPVIALLAEGAIVSIDGPPVDGFYPVTAGDLTGWMRGETMQLEKDTPGPDVTAGTEVDPLGDDTVESVPAEAPAEQEPATDAVADTAATLDGSVPADEPAPVNESAPVDPPAPDHAAAVAPVPAPVVSSVGPASVAVDAPIRTGPGPDFPLIVTAPMGSTIQQTGHIIDGYVTVQYAEATGWAAREHLGLPGSFVAETPPGEAAAVAEPSPVESPPAESPLVDPAPAETPLSATVSIAATPSDAAPVEAATIAAT